MTTAMGLGKCASCLDRALSGPGEVNLALIPDAVIMVTLLQQFSVGGGQQLAAPSSVAVCLECRRAQLRPVSKTGLVTA